MHEKTILLLNKIFFNDFIYKKIFNYKTYTIFIIFFLLNTFCPRIEVCNNIIKKYATFNISEKKQKQFFCPKKIDITIIINYFLCIFVTFSFTTFINNIVNKLIYLKIKNKIIKNILIIFFTILKYLLLYIDIKTFPYHNITITQNTNIKEINKNKYPLDTFFIEQRIIIGFLIMPLIIVYNLKNLKIYLKY
jgi:hypothetical protein